MKGRIKNYFNERGFGFIIGDDGNEYFFHISDILFSEDPRRGLCVEFSPSRSPKGLVAQTVYLVFDVKPSSTFVSFGNIRLKASNIKDYGISSGYVEITVNKPMDDSLKLLSAVFFTVPYLIDLAKTNGNPHTKVKEKQLKQYLYVTTYQNEYYKFWEHEVDFDVVSKSKELDLLFNVT